MLLFINYYANIHKKELFTNFFLPCQVYVVFLS